MDQLYSLYDALVSISVPNDKARAVVDAMERDMLSQLATKSDLQLLQAAIKADIHLLQAATKADLQIVRAATKADLQLLQATAKADLQLMQAETKAEFQLVRQEMATMRTLHSKDMQELGDKLTIKLGVMLAGAVAVLATLQALPRFLS